ncbi:hypothetical protein GGS26DRAFT_549948 [Hypomontagnella submonticulosa]|nr:hypothetical protein GGS26DRAFT_549948 [Hypomontagnella submonticulosa]
MQVEAREEFVQIFLNFPDRPSQQDINSMMVALDRFFFSGALTQRDPNLVELQFFRHDDAADWRNIDWIGGESEQIGLSDDDFVPWVHARIWLSRRLHGVFINLYWNWCPKDLPRYDGDEGGGHGPSYWYIFENCVRMISTFHPQLADFEDEWRTIENLKRPAGNKRQSVFLVLEKIRAFLSWSLRFNRTWRAPQELLDSMLERLFLGYTISGIGRTLSSWKRWR